MTTIYLNDNWQYRSTTPQSDLPAFDPSQPVTSLTDWSSDRQHARQIAWLKRIFELEPTDYCVNYVLHVEAAPHGTHAYVNGELIGTLPSDIDITLNVALGENEILLQVESNAPGRFVGVELRPVPCE
jgi:hypothetical protein